MEQIATMTAPVATAQPGYNNGQQQQPAQAQPLRIQFDISQIDVEFMVLMDEVQAQIPGAFARAMRYLDARTDVDLMRLPFNQIQDIMEAVNRQLTQIATRGN